MKHSRNWISSRIRAFRREEDGSMIVFSLFIFAMMMLVGGMAVDIMRFETYRARLQSTLDRAVLAAADLDVCLDSAQNAEDVVRDYVIKNGFQHQLDTVTVVEGFNSCSVSAVASIEVKTIFMQMIGVDQLSTPAASKAIEALNEIEISSIRDFGGARWMPFTFSNA